MKNTAPSGFRIYRQEPLPGIFKRLLLEQLDLSLSLSGRFQDNANYATHEIRKSTKRARAIYQLFRPVLGNEQYMHGKELYGSVSRMLAEHRLSAAYIEIMQWLSRDMRLPVNLDYPRKWILDKKKKHEQLTRQLILEPGLKEQLEQIFLTEITRLKVESPVSCEITDLFQGLKDTYKNGKKCQGIIINQTNVESLHNLRKKVKLLWNQLILLRPVWPAMLSPLIHQHDLLAEKLGLEHDLAELENYLILNKSKNSQDQESIMLEFISKKRKHFQKAIIPATIRLYAEKPEAFAGRIEGYFREFIK
jgi:CHAD domain-containing protein